MSERSIVAAQTTVTSSVAGPEALPGGWKRMELPRVPGVSVGSAYYRASDGLQVILSVEAHDEDIVLHVSATFRDRLPSWKTMVEVKRLFLGSEREAVMFIPPDDEYVNLHPFVHHLWAPVDKNVRVRVGSVP